MNQQQMEEFVRKQLLSAGITINGTKPWDIKVYNPDLYTKILTRGSLGLGEAYMNKWWDCHQLDHFFERVVRANIENNIKISWRFLIKLSVSKLINRQSKNRSLKVATTHYDLGNKLYHYMLDKRMNYSCGYWKNATNLDEAQRQKLELICQKLKLKPGMRILDIGCGFGSFAKYAAENFDVNVVGITISKEQYEFAKSNCAGLPIEICLQDYRNINDSFDRIVSIGMFEHVGYKNYSIFMKKVQQSLKDDGIFLLHTIGGNMSYSYTDEWIEKYIFPNSMLPSIQQIAKATEGLFVMEDWHNFGIDYDKTLMCWHQNFINHWDELKNEYDERFFRMWNYYLLSCAGSFRARNIQLWQIVFSKKGLLGGYIAPR